MIPHHSQALVSGCHGPCLVFLEELCLPKGQAFLGPTIPASPQDQMCPGPCLAQIEDMVSSWRNSDFSMMENFKTVTEHLTQPKRLCEQVGLGAAPLSV